MKKYQSFINGFVLIFALVLAGYLSGDTFAETAPVEAIAAAEAGLLPFLELITPEDMSHFGFSPGDNISEAVLGNPFQLFAITPAKLLNAKDNAPVSTLISPTGSWLFPVVLDGSSRALLTVTQMDGIWEAVGIGKAPLAEQLQEVGKQWPKSRGYDPVLIIIFQANSYFFAVPQVDDYNLNSFVFDGKGFDGEVKTGGPAYSTLTGLSKIVGRLKTVVAENIEDNNL
jgi:hypothetical protein